jgi:hypothetical protein
MNSAARVSCSALAFHAFASPSLSKERSLYPGDAGDAVALAYAVPLGLASLTSFVRPLGHPAVFDVARHRTLLSPTASSHNRDDLTSQLLNPQRHKHVNARRTAVRVGARIPALAARRAILDGATTPLRHLSQLDH